MKLYEVGGCVRDELLGLPSKDIDYSVEAESMDAMRDDLIAMGFEIFTENAEFFVIRARFPKDSGTFAGRNISGLAADFVLARRDGKYTDGRRPDYVEAGTLLDDLARRDFTVNAIAKDRHGTLIDPFGGQEDLKLKLLRTVGAPEDRFGEDALRALRAIRFSITKGFWLHSDLFDALRSEWLPALVANVAAERRREELAKAFKHDTLATLDLLHLMTSDFREAVFSDGLRLKPSLEA
jgi:tRNA nucleotidyltransferase (CCA-adding enzyme)